MAMVCTTIKSRASSYLVRIGSHMAASGGHFGFVESYFKKEFKKLIFSPISKIPPLPFYPKYLTKCFTEIAPTKSIFVFYQKVRHHFHKKESLVGGATPSPFLFFKQKSVVFLP